MIFGAGSVVLREDEKGHRPQNIKKKLGLRQMNYTSIQILKNVQTHDIF